MAKPRKPSLMERLRLKKLHRQQGIAVGVCWYDEVEWAKIKATAVDPERFENSFPEWVSMVEEVLRDFMNNGLLPVRVSLAAEDLAAWCSLHDKPNNAASRAEYVSELMSAGGTGAPQR